MSIITQFMKQEDGATAIEYGLIAALISVVIVVAVGGVGKSLNNTFTNVNSNLR